MVRDYIAPAWVDSVHHAVVTRTILDQNSIPKTYEPYLYSNDTSYHSGFHAILATYILLSNQNLRDGMLFFGQILNALTILVVYFFTTTLLKNKKIGLIAALIPAFFTPMPAYYTSWGRYTELTGLLILPIGIFFLNMLLNTDWNASLLNDKKKPAWMYWQITAISVLILSGLFLTHIRVTAFLIHFILAAAIILIIAISRCLFFMAAFIGGAWLLMEKITRKK